MLCIGLQVQKTLVEMVKTGATGINFDLELPLKVGGGKRVLWRGGGADALWSMLPRCSARHPMAEDRL